MEGAHQVQNGGGSGPKYAALNPEILSTPYKTQTNWYVLTGAACSGKTTLINMLAERGYQTGIEMARVFIDEELSKGRTIEEIMYDPTSEDHIDNLQISLENTLRPEDVAFLDRALPDSLTFRRFQGLDPNKILANCFLHRYRKVFLLDRLPLQLDGNRVADEQFASYLDEWLERDYSDLGYAVVRVPVVPPKERLEYILKRVAENHVR